MTGLLVIGTIAVVAFILVLLGAPGLFRPLVTYKIYFDNAVGIKQGAPVMLAGRKIGQVQKLFSPVSSEEEKRAEEAAAAIHPSEPNASPTPAESRAKKRNAPKKQPQPFIHPNPTPAPLLRKTSQSLRCASTFKWTRAPKSIVMPGRD